MTVHGRVSDIWRAYLTQKLLWDVPGQNICRGMGFMPASCGSSRNRVNVARCEGPGFQSFSLSGLLSKLASEPLQRPLAQSSVCRCSFVAGAPPV